MSSKVGKIVDIRNRLLQARDELNEAVSDLLGDDEIIILGNLYPKACAGELATEDLVIFTDMLVAVDKAIEGD